MQVVNILAAAAMQVATPMFIQNKSAKFDVL